MIKIEIVISAWDDGFYEGVERLSFIYDGATYPNLEEVVDKMVTRITNKKSKKIEEDDDIPF